MATPLRWRPALGLALWMGLGCTQTHRVDLRLRGQFEPGTTIQLTAFREGTCEALEEELPVENRVWSVRLERGQSDPLPALRPGPHTLMGRVRRTSDCELQEQACAHFALPLDGPVLLDFAPSSGSCPISQRCNPDTGMCESQPVTDAEVPNDAGADLCSGMEDGNRCMRREGDRSGVCCGQTCVPVVRSTTACGTCGVECSGDLSCCDGTCRHGCEALCPGFGCLGVASDTTTHTLDPGRFELVVAWLSFPSSDATSIPVEVVHRQVVNTPGSANFVVDPPSLPGVMRCDSCELASEPALSFAVFVLLALPGPSEIQTLEQLQAAAIRYSRHFLIWARYDFEEEMANFIRSDADGPLERLEMQSTVPPRGTSLWNQALETGSPVLNEMGAVTFPLACWRPDPESDCAPPVPR